MDIYKIAHFDFVVNRFDNFFFIFFAVSFGLLSLATDYMIAQQNKENNNILVNFSYSLVTMLGGVFLALAGGEC